MTWAYSLDPLESSINTVVGTPYYTAPEVILAAGWTIELLKRMENYDED